MAALAHKTVILVTHQVEFLSEVDTILVNSISISFYIILCEQILSTFCISRLWKVEK